MSEEKSLVDIAIDASLKTRPEDLGRGFYWSAIVSAIEKEVLARLNESEVEPVAGQELTIGQAAKIAEDYGSTYILEYFNDDLSRFMPCGYTNCIYLGSRYRVAPKKVNDPDDPTTWEKGVVVLAGSCGFLKLGKFFSCNRCTDYTYFVDFEDYREEVKSAKLATPEQVEAWKLINDDL